MLRVEDRRTRELKVKWSVGDYHQNPLDEKIARRVFSHPNPPLLSITSAEERPSFSILCAPLPLKGKSFGTLAFYDKESDSSKFDERDFQLLLMIANQMSCAIENALTHYETSNMAQKYEKRVAQLSTLWELNKALLTTVNFERILHLTLTAITIGDGLEFNRAMLFLVNEKEQTLEGTMAVGPDSAEEAGKYLDCPFSEKGNPFRPDHPTQSSEDHSTLNSIVKGIQIPLEQEQCILSRTVLEGKPFNIQSPQSKEGWLQTRCERGCHLGSEVGCYVGEHLSRDPKVYSFATVPLMGKGEIIGVILVDNLYNQNPITEDGHSLSQPCFPTRRDWPLRMRSSTEIWRRFIRNSRRHRTFSSTGKRWSPSENSPTPLLTRLKTLWSPSVGLHVVSIEPSPMTPRKNDIPKPS